MPESPTDEEMRIFLHLSGWKNIADHYWYRDIGDFLVETNKAYSQQVLENGHNTRSNI